MSIHKGHTSYFNSHLDLNTDETVGHVRRLLTRRRVISSFKHLKYNIYYPSFSSAPLEDSMQLADIGVKELSLLHVRLCLKGGARQNQDTGAQRTGMLALS